MPPFCRRRCEHALDCVRSVVDLLPKGGQGSSSLIAVCPRGVHAAFGWAELAESRLCLDHLPATIFPCELFGRSGREGGHCLACNQNGKAFSRISKRFIAMPSVPRKLIKTTVRPR
jgi:hypothetical protein